MYDEAALRERVLDLVVDGRCDGTELYDVVAAMVEWIQGDRETRRVSELHP